MKKLLTLSLGLLLLGSAACSLDPGIQMGVEEGALVIEQLEPGQVQGSFTLDGLEVIFGAEMMDHRAQVRVSLDGFQFEQILDHNTGRIELDGHGAILSRNHREALVAAALTLQRDFVTDELDEFHALKPLVGTLMAVGDSPQGYEFGVLSRSHRDLMTAPEAQVSAAGRQAASLANDGTTCIKYNHYYVAHWDGDQYHTTMQAVTPYWWSSSTAAMFDAFECHGLIGPGCGWAKDKWTLDALEHDTCVWQSFGSDPNFCQNSSCSKCGDEFSDAWDDYLGSEKCYGTTQEINNFGMACQGCDSGAAFFDGANCYYSSGGGVTAFLSPDMTKGYYRAINGSCPYGGYYTIIYLPQYSTAQQVPACVRHSFPYDARPFVWNNAWYTEAYCPYGPVTSPPTSSSSSSSSSSSGGY